MPKNAKLPYLRIYKEGILWTFLDSIGSHGLLILYHLFFRVAGGASLHGAMGCLHSTLYLLVVVSNIGLDATLAPFLEALSSSKKAFKQGLLTIIAPQLLILLLVSISGYAWYTLTNALPLITGLSSYLTPQLVGSIMLTFVLESLRKTLRTFLQLSFYFELTTLVELFGICVNVLGLLLFYTLSNLTLSTSWYTMALTSLIQLFLLLLGINHLYRALPDTTTSEPLFKRFTKTRLFSWALQCLQQLYSGNFLVPVCAMQFGIESASLMKVITSISYWITLLAKRVFGVTSNALLAHLKSRTLETQAAAFHYLSAIFTQGVSSLLIFLLITGKKLATILYQAPPQVTWSLLYVMLIFAFIESFFVLYEKWYILEEDAQTYLGINLLSLGCVYLATTNLTAPASILIAILGIRLATFFALTLFSFYRWRIWPSLTPHPLALISATTVSALFYVLL